MNTHSWWAFFITTFLICGAPGPNMLMMLSSSVRYGLRLTFFTMAGSFLAIVTAITVSVAGVGALLKASPVLFEILRYIGAGYLAYLGYQAWTAPVSAGEEQEQMMVTTTSPLKNFCRGFMVSISNPKALLFAAAFFPQFIDPNLPQLPQFLVLLATFSVAEVGWYMVYAMGGNTLSAYLGQHSVKSAFNKLTGGVFGAFGIGILFSRLD